MLVLVGWGIMPHGDWMVAIEEEAAAGQTAATVVA